MRRSWFTASLPHDKHRFDEGRPDRFEAPKASLNFSSNGAVGMLLTLVFCNHMEACV